MIPHIQGITARNHVDTTWNEAIIVEQNYFTSRSNYTGWAGFKFGVGSNPLTVKALGRYCNTGSNNLGHQMGIFAWANSASVCKIAVSMSAGYDTVKDYKYAYIPTAVTLSANTTYVIVSWEKADGVEFWGDTPFYVTGSSDLVAGSITSSYAGSLTVPVFAIATATTPKWGHCYGPLNFKYTL